MTANFSDNGFASATGASRPQGAVEGWNGSAATASMNAKVMASEKPMPSSAVRTRRSRATRGSDSAGACCTPGKVLGRCSKP